MTSELSVDQMTAQSLQTPSIHGADESVITDSRPAVCCPVVFSVSIVHILFI